MQAGIQEEQAGTWDQVEKALAAGAALEEFLPAECHTLPRKRVKATTEHCSRDASVGAPRLQQIAQVPQGPPCNTKGAPSQEVPTSAVAFDNDPCNDGPLQRWLLISQLRRVLSRADLERSLVASSAVAALTTADWCWVFAPPCGTSLRDRLLLHSRAPVPELLSTWLELLKAVGSRAFATFVLCAALPNHCRCAFGPLKESTRAAETEAARQLVKVCFDRLELHKWQGSQMAHLLRVLGFDNTKGQLAALIAAELRLHYFGATAVILRAEGW